MQTGAGGQHSDMAAALAFLMKSGRQLSPEPKYIGPSAVLCRAQPSRASQSSGMWKIDPRNGIYERTEKKDRVARVAYGHGMSADNSRGGVNNSVGEGSRASKHNSRGPHVYSYEEVNSSSRGITSSVGDCHRPRRSPSSSSTRRGPRGENGWNC